MIRAQLGLIILLSKPRLEPKRQLYLSIIIIIIIASLFVQLGQRNSEKFELQFLKGQVVFCQQLSKCKDI